MKCAWQEFLCIVPPRFRSQVDVAGHSTLQELRLRLGYPPELILADRSETLTELVQKEDLLFSVNSASRYSPWSAITSAECYLTAPGGHRVGLCGEAVMRNGEMTGIRQPTSLCIRVARDFPGIAGNALVRGSVLLIGRPGSGKTTLLRDLIRNRSKQGSVCVVDERGELFPSVNGISYFEAGSRTDIISGCTKEHGITAVLRTMGPTCIAVDEITAKEDAQALIQAAWSGVDLYATAHAAGKSDLYARPVYRELLEKGIFETLIVLRQDKSWKMERMEALC